MVRVFELWGAAEGLRLIDLGAATALPPDEETSRAPRPRLNRNTTFCDRIRPGRDTLLGAGPAPREGEGRMIAILLRAIALTLLANPVGLISEAGKQCAEKARNYGLCCSAGARRTLWGKHGSTALKLGEVQSRGTRSRATKMFR